MYRIKTLNNISPACRAILPEKDYVIGGDVEEPEIIFVRASNMLDYEFNDSLLCIARAGIGVNTIPIDRCAEKGIVVFNTPGANANGVKELFLFGIGMACRDIQGGMNWVQNFDRSSGDITAVMEKVKNRFVGPEYQGKRIGVVGMGNVGSRVANICLHLGMDVYGYDPYLSVDAAWMISHRVHRVSSMAELCACCDFITLHVPLKDDTRGMINRETIASMVDGVRIINYARREIVDEPSIIEALDSGKVTRYVTDFPANELIGRPNVIITPHLGGTTVESEENCAMMAAEEARDYLERGDIKNSVNFGQAILPATGNARLCIFHKNIPDMIAKITSAVSARSLNIENMVNSAKKRSSVAYTMLDLGSTPDEALVAAVSAVPGVIRVRTIPALR